MSPRDHPAFRADYKAARARIERKDGVLRQFVSVTRARVWRAIAALHAYMSVIAILVIALTNMERSFVYGKALGLDDEALDALVRLVAGYAVDRTPSASASPQRRRGEAVAPRARRTSWS